MAWNLQYEKLVQFRQKNGHCNVPTKGYKPDQSLGRWVSQQRCDHRKNKMQPDRKKLLVEIGFVWRVDRCIAAPASSVATPASNVATQPSSDDKKWHEQYEKLVEYRQKNGHCIVPHKYKQDKSLGRWVSNQRANHNNNIMRPDRKKLLVEIGFVWRVAPIPDHASGIAADASSIAAQEKWHEQYEKLVEFRRKIGHCIVPRGFEQDKSLGRWVNQQRCNLTKNMLLPDRKKLLVEIGFVWRVEPIAVHASCVATHASSIAADASGEDKKWHEQYEKLVEFRQINGHSIVPRGYEQDKSLGRWVNQQRCNHTKNILRPDRKKLLVEIGFVWTVDCIPANTSSVVAHVSSEAIAWHEQYKKLVEYRQRNDHCLVPRGYEQNKSLGRWVNQQRYKHTKNTLRPDRKKLLVEIGFVWKVDPIAAHASSQERKWHEQYKKLVEYRQDNGSSIVPFRYEQDKAFGRWANKQRARHASNDLRVDRKELLDKIGFFDCQSNTITSYSSDTDNVRDLSPFCINSSFCQALLLTLILLMLDLCRIIRIRIRKRPPASVRVFQTKQ